MNRINILKILSDYYNSFKVNGRILFRDIVIFAIVPLVIAGVALYFKLSFKSITGDLIKYIAIFGAFLFNLLALMFNSYEKVNARRKSLNPNSDEALNERILLALVKETRHCTTYAILLSIVLVVLLISYSITITQYYNYIVHDMVLSGIIFFLFTNYTLTLLMILNKASVVFSQR